MKKKIIYTLLIFVAIIILCSFTYSNREKRKLYDEYDQMEKLYFQGHSYICYKWRDGCNAASVGGASIIHDPDCKCNNERQTESNLAHTQK